MVIIVSDKERCSYNIYRRMAEWFKAAVLKTVGCQSPGGSNPSPSANFGNVAEWFKAVPC